MHLITLPTANVCGYHVLLFTCLIYDFFGVESSIRFSLSCDLSFCWSVSVPGMDRQQSVTELKQNKLKYTSVDISMYIYVPVYSKNTLHEVLLQKIGTMAKCHLSFILII